MKRPCLCGVVGGISLLLFGGLASCKKPSQSLPNKIALNHEDREPRLVGGYRTLRVPAAEWKILQKKERGHDYIPYKLLIGSDGTVQSVHLTSYTGGPLNHPFPPEPPQILRPHLAEAEVLLKGWRYEPALVAGKPVSRTIETSLEVAPPEKYGAPVAFPANVDMQTVLIGLRSYGCEGTCPVFHVTLDGNGLVTFEGWGYSKTQGKHETRVLPQVVTDLLGRFRDAKFLSALPTYVYAIDGSSFDIELKVNGITHIVHESDGLQAGMPDAFVILEKEIYKESGAEMLVSASPPQTVK